MSDLKPCPFCGDKPAVRRSHHEFYPYTVMCPECGCETGSHDSPESAAAAWNTRAPCPECESQRERANEARCREEGLRHSLNARFTLESELARLLGCEGLEGDESLRVAVDRAKALVAVAAAAKGVRDLGHDCMDCWGTWTGTVHESLRDDSGEWLECAEVEMQEGWEPCCACRLRAALAALDTPNTAPHGEKEGKC